MRFYNCHCEHSEAIQIQAYLKDSTIESLGEIKDYRLPRDSSESLAMTTSQPLRHNDSQTHTTKVAQ
ncbi:hypothetical protein [Helicobacter sp.]|uniref:hypothetical protein n=1 Tax=Helicobacter sp. TaxID=218 RepID=UPI0019C797A5|nr:hypothetical protein [Helicobacter sp.]MBD5165665.1 hypothetical protein [Helicobacter sp.]